MKSFIKPVAPYILLVAVTTLRAFLFEAFRLNATGLKKKRKLNSASIESGEWCVLLRHLRKCRHWWAF